jgi:hypothetical protein
METRIDEIGTGIYRISIFAPEVARPLGFTYNHFLILGDEPLLFHCGLRKTFPLVSGAVAKIIPVDQLRWLTFGHFEADECGSMNEWLAAAPHAQLAHGMVGVRVSIADMADRPPRVLSDGELSILAASACATSIRRMSPMAGMLASFSRKRREHCSAATYLPTSATLPRSPRATSSDQLWLRRTWFTKRLLGLQLRRPFANWRRSSLCSWLPCTVRHFPVMGLPPYEAWRMSTMSVCVRRFEHST